MPPGYLCRVCKQTATATQCLGEVWGLYGDTPGLGQGHSGHHEEVWEVEVPTLCVLRSSADGLLVCSALGSGGSFSDPWCGCGGGDVTL